MNSLRQKEVPISTDQSVQFFPEGTSILTSTSSKTKYSEVKAHLHDIALEELRGRSFVEIDHSKVKYLAEDSSILKHSQKLILAKGVVLGKGGVFQIWMNNGALFIHYGVLSKTSRDLQIQPLVIAVPYIPVKVYTDVTSGK
jgi:exosome complex RNA-binding protein Rrp4